MVADKTHTFSTSSQVTGKVYAANYAAPTPANLTTAVSDMQTAYTDAAGRSQWVKWRFEPRDGAKMLTAEEMAAAPRDFLEETLSERLKSGPVEWDMIVTLGESGDPTDNPTLLWPAGRREVRAGTLTLTSSAPMA